MTAKLPAASLPPAHAPAAPPQRPAELTEIERLVYPAWLDDDPASGGPNYLGHAALMMPYAMFTGLLVLLLLVAIIW